MPIQATTVSALPSLAVDQPVNKRSASANEWPYEKTAIPLLSAWIGSWQFAVNRRPMVSRELQQAYDQHAASWADRLKKLRIRSSYESALSRVLHSEIAAPATGEGPPLRVLDGGVGAADLSVALANVSRRHISLDAFDLSPRMLIQAEQQLSGLDVDARFHLADAGKLPFDDGQFDVVMTAHMLEHLAQPATALTELFRVLKPGGRLVTFITRRSLLAFAIQLKWRIHAVTPAMASHWLRTVGCLDVHCVEVDQRTLLDHLSVVCVGRKPEEA